MDDLTASLKTSLRGVDPGEIVAANLRDDGDLVVVCRSSAWALEKAQRGLALAANPGPVIEGVTVTDALPARLTFAGNLTASSGTDCPTIMPEPERKRRVRRQNTGFERTRQRASLAGSPVRYA